MTISQIPLFFSVAITPIEEYTLWLQKFLYVLGFLGFIYGITFLILFFWMWCKYARY